MMQMLRTLVRHRDLLYMLSRRDITVKYKQSIMGFLWAILMPMLITAAGVVVKTAMAQIAGRHMAIVDVIPVAVKSAPWAFFVASVRFSTESLAKNRDLVTKIAFPRVVFPLSAVASALFDFLIAAAVIFVILLFTPIHPTIHLLWVPLLLLILVVQVVGIAMLLSSANLFFRDVKYIVEVVLTFSVFFTPVFYSVAMFGEKGKLLLVNPVAPVLEGLEAAIVHGVAPDPMWTLYSAGWAMLLLLVTPRVFLKLEPKFAEAV